MHTKIHTLALSSALLLSGCTLEIETVGQGLVSSEDQTIVCTDRCTQRSLRSVKLLTLTAQPAPGYEFKGFVEDYKSSFEQRVQVVNGPLTTEYGGQNLWMGDMVGVKYVTARSRVTALFLPVGSTRALHQTDGSVCVLNVDQTHQCWGKSQRIAARLTPPVTVLASEIGDAAGNNHWCASSQSTLACWNEDTAQRWSIPATVSAPQLVAITRNAACVVHSGTGQASLACFDETGSALNGTPAVANPVSVTADSSGQFCAEGSSGRICWRQPTTP